jgi:nucleoside 2-deoxyribosyltransferase
MKKKVYLSGPMTGYPEYNYPAFNEAAKYLRDLGFDVYNPAENEFELDENGEFPIRKAFGEYCQYITQDADMIVALNGWAASKGARAETELGSAIGIPVFSFPNLKESGDVGQSRIY